VKALGLSFSVFVFAALAAPPAEAGFRAGFRAAFFHPSRSIGPLHGGGFRDENGAHRRDRDRGLGFYPGSTGLDGAAEAPPQYVPVPVPVPVPYRVTRWMPSHPRLILISHGQPAQSHDKLPEVVYGDPLPETRRP
jgi:hypothetical protein